MRTVRMLVLALVVLAAAPQAADARRHAKLVPAGLDPLTLHGSGFRRFERIRVTVTPVIGAPATKRVRANRHGSFRVTFRRLRADGNGLEAVAVGRRGSRASFQYSSGVGF
jgi:hypothetical protein